MRSWGGCTRPSRALRGRRVRGHRTRPGAGLRAARRRRLDWQELLRDHPDLGSFLFLGEILCSLPLVADEPAADQCGTCSLCIEACPTQALVGPGVLDARRCISYLTIGSKGPIPDGLKPGVGTHVYGCDVLPGGVPLQRGLTEKCRSRWLPRAVWTAGVWRTSVRMTDAELRDGLKGSAMQRARKAGMRRNWVGGRECGRRWSGRRPDGVLDGLTRDRTTPPAGRATNHGPREEMRCAASGWILELPSSPAAATVPAPLPRGAAGEGLKVTAHCGTLVHRDDCGRLPGGRRRELNSPRTAPVVPQLLDPNFARSVVLLCKHSDEGRSVWCSTGRC